ncbi:YecA family protein [Pseudidiomarina sediminum]|uniref:YecA family protein n=1 Tax=Pseudidiomarina sediminum TaxID=431675 RepID=UPI001C98AABB|nr:SEC-C metal-binding domain-containing protein [Pseudidiomarina sediminum]MBY6063199.1 SEC-C domain-containing protein [Pseudidiomarina sediminum]
MQYFDLPEICANTLKKCGVKKLEKIPVLPDENAKPKNCLNNVKSHIAIHGGTVQLGWIFSCMGNVVVKMTAHAVVRTDVGELICVTPNEYRTGLLKFAQDDSVSNLIINDFLPLNFVPLIDDKTLNEYISIEQEQDQLRMNNNGLVAQSDLQQLQYRASLLYPSLLSVAKKHTGRNDLCFCGSGKKNKKCCG